MRLKSLVLAASFAAVVGFASGQTWAQNEVIVAVSAKPGSLQYATSEEFVRRANEALGDKAEVKFFGSAQLGKDKELMQKLKLGTVHLALPSSLMSSIVPEAGLFDMPFLVKDRSHLAKIEKEIVWPWIAPAIEQKGYKLIGFWENGIRHITNNAHPINTPEDLKGVKLRTPNSVWRIKMFKGWGGNPTPMAFSEVFVALQTGVIDGQENPYTNIYAAKLHEVQKYLSVTGHVYTPAFFTAGKRAWAKLPDDVRTTLEKIAVDVQVWMYAKGEQDEKDLVAKLKAGGMQFNTADREAFVAASKPIYDEFAASVTDGGPMIEKAISLAQ